MCSNFNNFINTNLVCKVASKSPTERKSTEMEDNRRKSGNFKSKMRLNLCVCSRKTSLLCTIALQDVSVYVSLQAPISCIP